MARTNKRKPDPEIETPVGHSRWRLILNLLGGAAAVTAVFLLVRQAKTYVATEVKPPGGAIHVVLAGQPGWMTESLAQQIKTLVPKTDNGIFDPNLLPAAVARLQQSPWVRSVKQVRRTYGSEPGDTLVVDCDYRVPIAVVQWGDYYWLVDNDGTKLSEEFGRADLPGLVHMPDGSVNIRVIRGVKQPPPPAGHQWPGADLAAGLDLVKLFYGKSFLNEADTIDVSNFDGRVKRGSPHLTLETTYGTAIWWGRPVNAKDYFVEASTTKKLQTLHTAFIKLGRIDAGKSYFDIRYEYPLVPATDPGAEAATGPQ
jgi:hypothetical protein